MKQRMTYALAMLLTLSSLAFGQLSYYPYTSIAEDAVATW